MLFCYFPLFKCGRLKLKKKKTVHICRENEKRRSLTVTDKFLVCRIFVENYRPVVVVYLPELGLYTTIVVEEILVQRGCHRRRRRSTMLRTKVKVARLLSVCIVDRRRRRKKVENFTNKGNAHCQ